MLTNLAGELNNHLQHRKRKLLHARVLHYAQANASFTAPKIPRTASRRQDYCGICLD